MAKKLSRAKQKKKAVDLAKKIAKERDGYICQRCGKKDGKKDGAHIVPVEYDRTAANPENIITLCAHCHRLGKDSAHNYPQEFTRWCEKRYPGIEKKFKKEADEYIKNPFPKIDWEEVYKKLKEEKNENTIIW